MREVLEGVGEGVCGEVEEGVGEGEWLWWGG